MADFTQGGEWLFFYGETNISLKINIDSKQPTCMYVFLGLAELGQQM